MRIVRRVRVRNPLGLQLRSGARLVALVHHFHCRVTLRRDKTQCDARSLLNLMALGAAGGTELEMTLDGDDADKASVVLSDFFKSE